MTTFFIPAGCTPLVQSLDVAINRLNWKICGCCGTCDSTGEGETTKMGNAKQPARQNVVNWVSTAWHGKVLEKMLYVMHL